MDSQDHFLAEIREEIQEGFIKQIADKIVQGMDSLANATEDVKRRWIWELLQNAKDVPNKFGGVSVIVELYKDKLLFKHNGDCFTIKNLTSLIQQVSSKSDQGNDPNVTGKFGTGFITTHLLSRIFTIYGVAKSKTNCCKKFKMIVDRDANNSHDMIIKIKDALDELVNLNSKELIDGYEENRKEDDMDTSFEYPLNSETYEYANIGVQDLLKVLPYSLLFIPLLKKVTVFIHADNGYQKFLVQRQGEIKGEGIEIITIVKEEQVFKNNKEVNVKSENSTFIMNSRGRLNVVWPIQQKEEEKTKILRISCTLPKLFCSFPLIGSENFYQPMIINSGEFYPNEPRNTIFLRNAKTPQVQKNRSLLLKSNELFKELIQYGINNNFEDFFNLFTDKQMSNDYIDHNWLIDQTYTPRILYLLNQPLVKTVMGVQTPVMKMYFPKAATKELRKNLWELYRKYFHDKIVILDELEKWYEVLSQYPCSLNIHQFVEKISQAKCLSMMDQFEDDESRIKFINELIKFIKATEKNDPLSHVSLSDNPIIPNRRGRFVPHKRLISDRKRHIPEEIKNIYFELFERSLDDLLIHHLIELELNDYQNYDSNKAMNEINSKLSTLKYDQKDKKEEISLMLVELIPIKDSEDPNSERLKIIEFLQNLEFKINKKPLNDVPFDTWRVSDPVVFTLMIETLVSIGESKGLKPVDKLAKTLHLSVNDAMEWMNKYISFMRDVKSFNQVTKAKIIPRQDSYFGSAQSLYIDDRIPQTIKNILSNIEFDIYSELMDNRINCFPGHQKMDIDIISRKILDQIDIKPQVFGRGKNMTIVRKNPSTVYDIAMKLICLQSEKGNQSRKEFYELIEPVDFSELISGVVTFKMNVETIDSTIHSNLKPCIDKATRFLGLYIIEEMTRKGVLNDIKNIFKSSYQNETFIRQWYISFIHFISSSGQFLKELLSNAIYLNQNGKFISKDAQIDADHDEDLLKISQNSLFNRDYKSIFVIPEIVDVLDEVYHGFAKKTRSEDIAKYIDDRVKQYNGNKQDAHFVSLILQIRDLFLRDPKYKIMMPFVNEQMDQLILNTLNSETLSSIVQIVSNGNTEILNNLTEISPDEIHQFMELKKTNASQTLLALNSMNDNDKQYINEHPEEFSRFIQNQRENERLREEHERFMERLRQDRERRRRELENMSLTRNIPISTYHRQRNTNIHNFTHFITRTQVHFEPPPPPPRPFMERLNNSIEQLLRKVFESVKPDGENNFYCKLVDDEEADEYLIIPIFKDKDNELDLNHHIVEFTNDFIDTSVLLIVPSENDFKENSFKDDVRIITSIGFDLDDLNIVDSISDILSTETEYFSVKGLDEYFIHVKEEYIDANMKGFNDWKKSFQSENKD